MLRHKFFHRAKKIVITEEELNKMRGIKKKTKDVKEERKLSDKEDSKDMTVVKEEKVEEKVDERKESKKKPKVNVNVDYRVIC